MDLDTLWFYMQHLVIYHGRSQNGQAKPACSLLGYLPADWTATTQFQSGGWLAQSKQHINTQDWEVWVKREALWLTHSIKGRSKEFQFYEMFQLHVFVSRFSARSLGFQLGVGSSVAETVFFFFKSFQRFRFSQADAASAVLRVEHLCLHAIQIQKESTRFKRVNLFFGRMLMWLKTRFL